MSIKKAKQNSLKQPSVRKPGRPKGSDSYTSELADCICVSLSDGQSLRAICRKKGMPALSTVFKWLRTHKDFSEQYARAREAGADAMIEDILAIADDTTEDIQRSRLKVDARKWVASKILPKKYSARITNEHNVTDGSLCQFQDMTDEQLDAQLAKVLGELEVGRRG